MYESRHTKTSFCNKFSHSSTLENFQEWTNNLQFKERHRGNKKSKAELGQKRLALTAFINALTVIHRESISKSEEISSCSLSAHNNLYIALRLCFMLGLKSRNTVRKLIQEIFVCDGNLYSIFSVLSFCHVTKKFPSINIDSLTLYPCVTSNNFDKTVVPAFEYYLQCINSPENYDSPSSFRLNLFLNHAIDENSADTPLMAATIRKNPLLVGVLLRHGADPLHRLGVLCEEGEHYMPSPMSYIICFLNSYCALTKYSNTFDNYIFKQAIECFNRMSNMVANMQIRVAGIQWRQEDHLKIIPSNHFTVNAHLTPYISLSNFNGPSSLLQLCHVFIRKELIKNSNDLLSISINSLAVPSLIRNYIHLQ